MEIVWHAHNAVVSDRLRARAESGLVKLATRLNRTVTGTIRFEREVTRCRVELMLHAARHKTLIAEGNARYYGPALTLALDHLETQVARERRTAKQRNARLART
jgi:ribosome-associated translation inhibitor RaiA